MRVYLLLRTNTDFLNEELETIVKDYGIELFVENDEKIAFKELKRRKKDKPDAVIISDLFSDDQNNPEYKLILKKLADFRKICPQSEIIFLSVVEPLKDFEEILESKNIKCFTEKDFDLKSFIIQHNTTETPNEDRRSDPSKEGSPVPTSAEPKEVIAEISADHREDVHSEQMNTEKNEKISSEQPAKKIKETKPKLPITIFLADGYERFVEPFRSMPDIKLLGVARSREEIFSKVEKLKPDVVTLSPDISGETDILEIVDLICSNTRVIFLNSLKLPKIDREMLKEYKVEFLDEITIGALEFKIKSGGIGISNNKKAAIEQIAKSVSTEKNIIPNLIGITSIKSTGKSTIAVNLAAKMAEAGNTTLLIDLANDQDIGSFLDIDGHESLKKAFETFDDIKKIACVPKKLGLDNLLVLNSEPGMFTFAHEKKKLLTLLEKLSNRVDYIIVDLPSGFRNTQADVLLNSAGVVLVVADTNPSRNDRLRDEFDSILRKGLEYKRFALILNNVAADFKQEEYDFEANIGLDISFIIPSKISEINKSIRNKQPLCLYNSEFSNIFTEISEFVESAVCEQRNTEEE